MSSDTRDDEMYEILYDSEGKSVRRMKMQSQRTSKDGEFTTYDTRYGHCELCGRLGCHGSCFR